MVFSFWGLYNNSDSYEVITTSLDNGTYIAPNKLIVTQWLDIWVNEYLGGVKPLMIQTYQRYIEKHVKGNLKGNSI